jgi:hypothetical protein
MADKCDSDAIGGPAAPPGGQSTRLDPDRCMGETGGRPCSLAACRLRSQDRRHAQVYELR